MSNLDTKISSYGPKHAERAHPSSGDIGIEVEMEGVVGDPNRQTTRYWLGKPDGSLRSGYEYILMRPVTIDEFPLVEKTFLQATKGYSPTTSIRTSTHIHINVARLTVRQVYSAALLYYLLEELFVKTQPPERQGNLFCLRMSDSRAIAGDLRRSLRGKQYFRAFDQSSHKYSAQNLAAVSRYGSLEYRFMQAMLDPADFLRFARALHEMVTSAAKNGIDDVLASYETLLPNAFVLKYIPSGSWLVRGQTQTSLNSSIHTNYDAVVEIARALRHHDRFVLPKLLWDNDIDPDERGRAITTLRHAAENSEAVSGFGIDQVILDEMTEHWTDGGNDDPEDHDEPISDPFQDEETL